MREREGRVAGYGFCETGRKKGFSVMLFGVLDYFTRLAILPALRHLAQT